MKNTEVLNRKIGVQKPEQKSAAIFYAKIVDSIIK